MENFSKTKKSIIFHIFLRIDKKTNQRDLVYIYDYEGQGEKKEEEEEEVNL